MGKIAEHKVVTLKNDCERVRKRATIYIPDTGNAGAVHIIFEIVDNSIDELTANDAVDNGKIVIDFDDKTKVCTITDNGGGIPIEGLLNACTVLNSSGKFENSDSSHFGTSGGVNGIGLKLSVFLSEWCEVTTKYKGTQLKYRFEDGVKVSEEKSSTKDHGTIVSFKIDKKFVDVNSVEIDQLAERIHEKSYLFPNIKFTFRHLSNGDVKKENKYFGEDIYDRVVKFKPDTQIIRVQGSKTETILADVTDDKLTKKDVIVDLAFAYKEDALDTDNQMKYIITYGNTIKNYMGGTHLEGLKLGIQKFFKEKIIPNLKGKDKELPIMPSDMVAGLCGFVVARLLEPEFRGQYKDQLSNPEVKYAVRDIVFDALCKEKQSVINQMFEFVKRITKGRMASKKVRKKDVSNAFSTDFIEKYIPIINSIKTTDPELLLAEG